MIAAAYHALDKISELSTVTLPFSESFRKRSLLSLEFIFEMIFDQTVSTVFLYFVWKIIPRISIPSKFLILSVQKTSDQSLGYLRLNLEFYLGLSLILLHFQMFQK